MLKSKNSLGHIVPKPQPQYVFAYNWITGWAIEGNERQTVRESIVYINLHTNFGGWVLNSLMGY